MLVVRGTKKLRDRVKAPMAGTDESSSTVLGDWFATALFWRPQVALLVNERTMLPVFMPLAPAATLLHRIPTAIASALRQHGANDVFIGAELAAMQEVRIAPTNNRSLVGVMNELAFHGELHWNDGLTDLEALSYRISSVLLGPLDRRGGSPDRALAAELGAVLHGRSLNEPSNVIEFPRRSSGPTPQPNAAAPVYQLKVTLVGTKPPVWRRLLVPASISLDKLHEVIQAAFGWWNYHLYEFEVGKTRYALADPDWDFGPPPRSVHRTRLHNIVDVGGTIKYTYDFGDDWVHKITVEKSLPRAADVAVPACIDGRRAAPPEDCGGVWGYEELLAILADPSHPEYEERAMWAGDWGRGTLDPEAFDPSEFAVNLETLRLAALD